MSTSSAVRIETDAISEASSETYRPSRKPGAYKRTKKAPPPPPNGSGPQPTGEDCAIDERLEGTLDLKVVLPDRSGIVELTVDRRTAILDVLVQATVGTKLSPGDHHLLCQPGEQPPLPNTPVGTLDTRTLFIVPKAPVSPQPTSTMPFAPSIRVTVNLPRKQLAVIRVGPTTALADIKRKVCQDHTLDSSRHRLMDPRCPDSLLDLNTSLTDFGHNELTLISNDDYTRSSQEYIPLTYNNRKVIETNHSRTTQGLFDMLKKGLRRPRKKEEDEQAAREKHRSSVSLPVTRSTSPARSESTRSLKKKAPPPPPPHPPPPPTLPPPSSSPQPSSQKTHSRHSSDSSSGYHEASVLSDSPESSATTVESPSVSPRPLDQCPPSLTTSRTSVSGTSKKRKAPPPPVASPPPPVATPPPPIASPQPPVASPPPPPITEAASSVPPSPQPVVVEEEEVPPVRSTTSTPQGSASPEDLENRLTETFTLSPIKRSSSLPDLVEITPELEEEEELEDKEEVPPEAAEVWEIPAPPSPFRSSPSPAEPAEEPENSPLQLEENEETDVVLSSVPETTFSEEENCETIIPIMPRHRRLENFSIGAYKKQEEDIYATTVEKSETAAPKPNGVIPKAPVEEPEEVVKNGDEIDDTKNAPEEPVEKVIDPMKNGFEPLKEIIIEHMKPDPEVSVEKVEDSAPTEEANGKEEYEKQLEQFRHLEQQLLVWKEQLAKNQAMLEKTSETRAERSQTLPRRPISLQLDDHRTTVTLNRRPKPHAMVSIGSWDQRSPSTVNEVLDSDIVYAKKVDATTKRKSFASSVAMKPPSKAAPFPPRKSPSVSATSPSASNHIKPTIKSEVKKAPAFQVSTDIKVNDTTPNEFLLMQESIKRQAMRPSAQGASSGEERLTNPPLKASNGIEKYAKQTQEPVKIKVKQATSQVSPVDGPDRNNNSPTEETLPKPAPRRFPKLNGGPSKSVSDSKAALMEELKKRLTPSPPPTTKTFPASPPRRPKSSVALDPRAELMLEIRNFAGRQALHSVATLP